METNQQMLTRMTLDMRMRGMSQHSLDVYIRCVRFFLEWRSEEGGELDESTARAYLVHLIHAGKHSTGTVNMYNAAIRFFYAVTLNRTINYLQLPRFKKHKTLPEIDQRTAWSCQLEFHRRLSSSGQHHRRDRQPRRPVCPI